MPMAYIRSVYYGLEDPKISRRALADLAPDAVERRSGRRGLG